MDDIDDMQKFLTGDRVRATRKYPGGPAIGAIGTVIDTFINEGVENDGSVYRLMVYIVDYGTPDYARSMCYNQDIEGAYD